jgi:hypothetical protein
LRSHAASPAIGRRSGTVHVRLLAATIVASVCAGCSPPAPPPAGENALLGGEVAARVGGQPIPLAIVQAVAEKQGLSPADAARRVIDDEIAASGARARGLDLRGPASWQLTAARGRFSATRLLEEAKRRGPPSDDEVTALSEKHWAEVDRPPTFRVIHAIVIRPKDVALNTAARRLAEEVREAVQSTKNDAFEARAKSVLPKDTKLELRVERLPPFTDDGWTTDGGRMDATFSRAAANLAPGETSGVVETSFGYHVIRLFERLPEKRMPVELRRIAFADEVYSLRAHADLDATLKTLRAAHPIVVSPAAEQLMRSASLSAVNVKAPRGTSPEEGLVPPAPAPGPPLPGAAP